MNTLILYTQQGIDGRTVATSGYVAVPDGRPPEGGWPVVAWAHGTTGIADGCAPTRDANERDAAVHGPLLERWIAAGYAVVRTDYEGLGTPGEHPYLIGGSEGRAVLDSVRAARALYPSLSRDIVVAGHSQGGHAALWAGSLAPSYTPELRLRGTLAFAPPSSLALQMSLLGTQKSAALSGTAMLILRGAQIADPSIDASLLLSDTAAALYPRTLAECSATLRESVADVPASMLLKAGAGLSPLQKVLNANDPGRLRIRGPVQIEQGSADKTVLPVLSKILRISLLAKGTAVSYRKYSGATHETLIEAASDSATAFLARSFPK